MRGALILCALVLFAGQAHAVDGGAVDPNAPVHVDGGDPVPFDGWEFSDAAAQNLLHGVQVCYGAQVELQRLLDAGCSEAPALAVVTDGGFLDVPLELQAGQPAPAHGWWLSQQRAEQLVQNGQAAAPASSSAVVVATVAFVLGAAAGAYVALKASH